MGKKEIFVTKELHEWVEEKKREICKEYDIPVELRHDCIKFLDHKFLDFEIHIPEFVEEDNE